MIEVVPANHSSIVTTCGRLLVLERQEVPLGLPACWVSHTRYLTESIRVGHDFRAFMNYRRIIQTQ